MATLVPPAGQVEELAVHVELNLSRGSVPGPDRSCAPVAFQVLDRDLGQPPLSAHSVHDLQVAGIPRRAAFDEPSDAVRLGVVAELRQ